MRRGGEGNKSAKSCCLGGAFNLPYLDRIACAARMGLSCQGAGIFGVKE